MISTKGEPSLIQTDKTNADSLSLDQTPPPTPLSESRLASIRSLAVFCIFHHVFKAFKPK